MRISLSLAFIGLHLGFSGTLLAEIKINSLHCQDETQTIFYESNRSSDNHCFFPIDQWTIAGAKYIEPISYCSHFSPEVIAGGYTSKIVKSTFDVDSYVYLETNLVNEQSQSSYTINASVRHPKSKELLFSGRLHCTLSN